MGEQDIDVQKGIADLTQYQYREGFVKAFPNKSDHGEAQLESEEKQLSKDKIQTNQFRH